MFPTQLAKRRLSVLIFMFVGVQGGGLNIAVGIDCDLIRFECFFKVFFWKTMEIVLFCINDYSGV